MDTSVAHQITELASLTWSQSMPVSYAVQRCIDAQLYYPYLKRFIEVTYERLDTDYDTWLNYEQFEDGLS